MTTTDIRHITATETTTLDAACNLLNEIRERLVDASYTEDDQTETRRLIICSCAAATAYYALSEALISFRVRLAAAPEPVEPQSIRA